MLKARAPGTPINERNFGYVVTVHSLRTTSHNVMRNVTLEM